MNTQLGALVEAREGLSDRLGEVPWLRTPRGAAQLIADFGVHEPILLDFRIGLSTGFQLTHPNHRELLLDIQDFLCIQGLPRPGAGRALNNHSQRRHFIRACKIVDHLLLVDRGKLARFGFAAATSSDLSSVLIAFASNGGGDEGLYRWRDELRSFLLSYIEAHSIAEWSNTSGLLIDKSAHESLESPVLQLTEPQLHLSRCALAHLQTALSEVGRSAATAGQVIAHIRATIYRDTLLGKTGFLSRMLLPDELSFRTTRRIYREFPRVYVPENYDSEFIRAKGFYAVRETILSSKRLSMLGLGFAQGVLHDFEGLDHSKLVPLVQAGGFRHAPPHLVVKALRHAISFFYEHGDHLLSSCARVLRADTPRLTARGARASREVLLCLSPETLSLGVKEWAIWLPDGPDLGKRYASTLRESRSGLWDLVQVLYGACMLIVGVLVAPRNAELLDIADSDLSANGQFVGLFSRKTGFDNHRRYDEVPLPKVAADILLRLKQFRYDANELSTHVFSAPTVEGKFSRNDDFLYGALDRFLDFIELDLTSDGRRHYFRQHQFRKFFAAVFFYSCRFAGLDTLRWMLRHVDVKQVWAYVRSSVPGELLHHYFATTAAELIRDGASELFSLSELLQAHFGVSDLSVVSVDELSLRLEALQASGRVVFEPVFVTQDDFVEVYVGATVFGEHEF